MTARVLIKCPATERTVPTGFRMTEAKLELSDARYAFRCAACGSVHQWVRSDAWIELSHRYTPNPA